MFLNSEMLAFLVRKKTVFINKNYQGFSAEKLDFYENWRKTSYFSSE